jgi:PAS domain S-box-containing protein
MKPFRDQSIRTKLPVTIRVAILAALVVSGVAFSVHHYTTFSKSVREDMQVLAQMVSVYTRDALRTGDTAMARRALQPLRDIAEVKEAAIIDASGAVLARIFSDPPAGNVLRDGPPIPSGANVFTARVLDTGGAVLGQVCLRADLNPVMRRIWLRNLLIVLLGGLVAFVISPVVTHPLQRMITAPIFALTEAAAQITREGDYTVRAKRFAGDELGALVDGFNTMLAQLESRDMALRESADRYRTLMENLPVGIGRIMPGEPHTLTQANPALPRILGWSSAEAMSAASRESGGESHEPCQTFLKEVLAEAAEPRSEVAFTRLGGKPIWANIEVHVERNEQGELLWVDFALEDVTKRVWAEQELRRYREQLEELVERRTGELTRANARLQREIAERARAERALQENLHFLQALIDSLPNPVFYKDTFGQYLGCNNAFSHMMRLPKERIIGRQVFDVAPDSHAARYDAAEQNLLREGHDQVYESTVRFGDGRDHPVIFYKGAFRDAQGQVAGIIGTVLDISDRKRAEERIAKLNECLLSFGPAPMENIYRLTRVCGELLGATYAFYSHYEQYSTEGGESPGIVCRWQADAALAPLPDAWNHVAEDLMEEGRLEAVVLHRHRDEHYWLSDAERGLVEASTFAGRPVLCHGHVIGCLALLFADRRRLETEEEQLIGVIAAAISVEEHRRHAEQEREAFLRLIMEYSDGLEREVSERKRAEQQLQDYAKRLAHTNEELKEFASIVSHDLRAPLVNIKGFIAELRLSLDEVAPAALRGMVQLGPEQGGQARRAFEQDIPEALAFVDSATSRMDRLLTGMLQLSRAGRRVLQLTQVDTGVLVQGVVRALSHQIEQHHATVEIADGLPVLTADADALDQIFGNLIDNAVKFLAPDRPGYIKIYAGEDGEAWWFSVEDNGRGILDEDREHVFQVFRRSGDDNVAGEGMGLAFVRTMVRRLGGDVHCEASQQGEGTRFYFNVPKHIRETPQEAEPPPRGITVA